MGRVDDRALDAHATGSDLAGTWQLAFDPDGEGSRRGWMNGRWPADRAEAVQVPGLWNLTHPDYAGAGWYRTVVDLPGDWADRMVRLHVGGASYRTEAWLNGRFLGSHEGAYTAFWFDATAAARLGEPNELVLRVTSLSLTRSIDGMALREMPVSKQWWLYPEGGLWGDVWFESVPLLSCEAIAIEPDLRQESARIEVRAANAGADSRHVELDLTITDPRGATAAEWRASIVAPPGDSSYLVDLPIPRPLAWSCDEPNLYRAQARLIDGGDVVDEIGVHLRHARFHRAQRRVLPQRRSDLPARRAPAAELPGRPDRPHRPATCWSGRSS